MMSSCRGDISQRISLNHSKESRPSFVYLLLVKTRVLQSCLVQHLFHKTCRNKGSKLSYSCSPSQWSFVFLYRNTFPSQGMGLHISLTLWKGVLSPKIPVLSCHGLQGRIIIVSEKCHYTYAAMSSLASELCRRYLPPSGASGLFRFLHH